MPKSPALIFVEGLPGSGKTTFAQFAATWLGQAGRTAHLYLEGNLDHPADYESVACLSPADFERLLAAFPDQRQALIEASWQQGDQRFFSYRKPLALPDDVLQRLVEYEIYELPPDQHQRIMRQNWQRFADSAAYQEGVTVFECCFFQNPLTVLLGKHNLEIRQAKEHILGLAEIVDGLNPALMYIDSGSARQSLERGIASRPKEWLDFITAYHTQQGLGMARGWQGLDGLVRFMELRQEIERELFERLPWRKAWINGADWEARRHQAEDFLRGSY